MEDMPEWNRGLTVVGALAGYALFAALTGRTTLVAESLGETAALSAIATACCTATIALVHVGAALVRRNAR